MRYAVSVVASLGGGASEEVSRADCSRKSGVALPKREICGMANAIPAIPSPPPMLIMYYCFCEGDEDRQLYEEAMTKGYIESALTVLILVGVTGSGKTLFKRLVLGLSVPEYSTSRVCICSYIAAVDSAAAACATVSRSRD